MRPTLPLLIIGAWAIAAGAQAQTAGSRAAHGVPTAHPAAHSRSRPARARPGTDARPGKTPGAGADGVLALGATDITGNKELPKVMVIVPWKSPAEAGGVMKPADSLLDEVLGPVDRGVFQRQIRYYGQLNAARGRPEAGAAGGRPGAGRVAPVGDSH